MKLTEVLAILTAIKVKFGDLPIVGGILHDDTPLRIITVINNDGEGVWEHKSEWGPLVEPIPAHITTRNIEGIFLEY